MVHIILTRFFIMNNSNLLKLYMLELSPLHQIMYSELVSDCCLMPIQQFVSYIMERTI
jgi:hypothetical protein